MLAFEPLARLDDVPEGGLVPVVRSDGTRICLINLAGEVHAVSDVCTHQEFPMSQGTLLWNGMIECAWHGARFDCRTGAAMYPPADEPLPRYEVRVENGTIFVGGRKP
ncbi:MAG: non-heme iron oxygenase ferredoxin subunit [Gemmatimonadota bacterium]|nr:non-heme iron oxygenase ferredoxin subunit [Gemmatimonadota bacterium]